MNSEEGVAVGCSASAEGSTGLRAGVERCEGLRDGEVEEVNT